MISIITATYNSKKTVRRTIDSLLIQNYENWELLICDGGSNDGTLQIIKEYNDDRIKIVSTNDAGIFDAYNKGLDHIKGEIFGTLNSDDHLADENVLELIHEKFQQYENCDLIYGNVTYLQRKNGEKISRVWRNNFTNQRDFKVGFMPAHPTVYMRNNPKMSSIRYNPKYRFAGDFEYLIRVFKVKEIHTHFTNKNLVNMLDGGTADGNLKNKYKHWRELDSILKFHYGKGIGLSFIFSKFLNRFLEYLK